MSDPQQQPTQGMQGYPYPMLPMYYQQQQVRDLDSQAIPNVVPIRVDVAFAFVGLMRVRMLPQVAIDNMGNMQVEEAKELTSGEEAAFHEACVTLRDYFSGQLDMDKLEKQRSTANNFELTKRCPGVPQVCPVCLSKKMKYNNVCGSCGGTGKVIIVPYDGKENQEG